MWMQTLAELRASEPKFTRANVDGVKTLGDVSLPDGIRKVLNKGPKFAIQPVKTAPELLTLVRQVSELAPEADADRYVATKVENITAAQLCALLSNVIPNAAWCRLTAVGKLEETRIIKGCGGSVARASGEGKPLMQRPNPATKGASRRSSARKRRTAENAVIMIRQRSTRTAFIHPRGLFLAFIWAPPICAQLLLVLACKMSVVSLPLFGGSLFFFSSSEKMNGKGERRCDRMVRLRAPRLVPVIERSAHH
ncbi:hypothetical protein HPB51_009206 [Rhipicephalus microplus]|uniref:Uncharacterized protein n=1 Tax=Rhipicephalus microplus TaxID=6941 RepID=A0A9J6EZK3_RHIMP|nr:hypothetical protein HPB51_009206 [Rhipicephalus microplus]